LTENIIFLGEINVNVLQEKNSKLLHFGHILMLLHPLYGPLPHCVLHFVCQCLFHPGLKLANVNSGKFRFWGKGCMWHINCCSFKVINHSYKVIQHICIYTDALKLNYHMSHLGYHSRQVWAELKTCLKCFCKYFILVVNCKATL